MAQPAGARSFAYAAIVAADAVLAFLCVAVFEPMFGIGPVIGPLGIFQAAAIWLLAMAVMFALIARRRRADPGAPPPADPVEL